MTSTDQQRKHAAVFDQSAMVLIDQLRATIAQKDEKIALLEHQFSWFKRQLFGEKSEKRDMTENPFQHTIADMLKELPAVPECSEEEKQTVSYQRGKAKKNVLEGSPYDSGLRFNENVPVEEITVSVPGLEGEHAHHYDIISHKITYRLAQWPGSYVILKYTRPVIKEKTTQQIITTPAPAKSAPTAGSSLIAYHQWLPGRLHVFASNHDFCAVMVLCGFVTLLQPPVLVGLETVI